MPASGLAVTGGTASGNSPRNDSFKNNINFKNVIKQDEYKVARTYATATFANSGVRTNQRVSPVSVTPMP